MKKTITICITIIILLLVCFFVYDYFKNKQLAEINKQLEIRENKIRELWKEKDAWLIEKKELEKKKVITKIEYITLTVAEKEEAYYDLYDYYLKSLKLNDDAEKIIEEQAQIIQADEKIINDLKAMTKIRKFDISGIASIGLDQELNLNASEGLILKGMFLGNRISVGGGIGISERFKDEKIIIGGNVLLELAIYF